MGQYTIVADASVFQGDAGTYRVESLNLLKIRLTLLSMRAAAPNANTRHRFAVTRWRSEVNSNCQYRFLNNQTKT
jgi:hypothetical protein